MAIVCFIFAPQPFATQQPFPTIILGAGPMPTLLHCLGAGFLGSLVALAGCLFTRSELCLKGHHRGSQKTTPRHALSFLGLVS